MPSQIRPKNPQQPQTLLDFVQQHERQWGTENYPNRPSLAEILGAKVVVFWKPVLPEELKGRTKTELRETITLHTSLQEVEQFIIRLVFRIGVAPLDKQLVRVFHNQKKVKIKGVKIVFEEDSTYTDDTY